MESKTVVENEMSDMLTDLFGSERFGVLERAHAFATYVVPSKEFVNMKSMIDVAEHLIDKLETEISQIKAVPTDDREPKLVAARAYKKDIRGFLIYERKYV